jgi:hypothetical protein
MKNRILLLALVGVLVLAGCRRAEITNIQRDAAGGVDVTAKLTEAEMNDAIADALAVSNPLLREPKVDLQPGQIVINGKHDKRDGSGTVSGSLTMTLSIQNGALLAQVTQASIDGVDITSDPRVAELNQRIAERVTRRADRENRQITVKSVSITSDTVEVVFNVKRT